jgi:hypothetical protein
LNKNENISFFYIKAENGENEKSISGAVGREK